MSHSITTKDTDYSPSPDGSQIGMRFITGMSRAGTTWLCKSMNQHPDVAAFGESRFFARHFVPPGPDGLYDTPALTKVVRGLTDRILNTTMGNDEGCLPLFNHRRQKEAITSAFRDVSTPFTPGDVFSRFVNSIAHSQGKRVPIEKTPQHIMWVERILGYYPDCRIIVMLRDPYTFMLSYKHQGDRKPDRIRKEFERRYHPLACALIWRGYMRAALTAQQTWPDNLMLVRLEDAQNEPATICSTVLNFFGIDPHRFTGPVPSANTSFPDGIRPRLEPEDLFFMNLIAQRDIKEYGSQIVMCPHKVYRIGTSFMRLPVWAAKNIYDMHNRVSHNSLGYLWNWLRGKTYNSSAP